MAVRCIVSLAIVCHMSMVGGEEPAPAAPAAEQPDDAPLVLTPVTTPPSHNAGSPAVPAATLDDELQRLKQEQDSIRALLNDSPSEPSPDVNRPADSAKRLRMQLDQLSSELERRQVSPKGQITTHGTARSAAPGTVQDKPLTAVSKATIERMASPPIRDTAPDASIKPVDPVALGQVLLRMDDYEGAVRAFRAVELTKLRADDRAYVQFLLASALRCAGQAQEALPLYREVANSKADATIAECARWQLALMLWQRDLEAQLESIRQRRKTLGSDAAPGPPDTLGVGQSAIKENP